MRIGVVTDIHSNLVALETVLGDMGPVDALWCLGDIVGYGPWPNECISIIRERADVVIAGNHDLVTVGSPLVSADDFNPDAAAATQWTQAQLTAESSDFLEELEPRLQAAEVTFAHGSPRQPAWEYLLSSAGAAASFKLFDTQLCLVGHTHIPSLFVDQIDGNVGVKYMEADTRFEAGEQRCIANPGSVGQSRDHDSRAAYLMLEMNGTGPVLEWKRIPYDIGTVQEEMRRVGLPQFFIERLEHGV
ncbi:MAG: metallophosphoesterase [Chloroflexi bacterium]|nr:metallophosphoesterase [Chloroflexota bacterium]